MDDKVGINKMVGFDGDATRIKIHAHIVARIHSNDDGRKQQRG